jgi:Xaa-Pro aminopeptidase
VEAIRAIEKNIVLGMTERVVRETLSDVLRRAGMTPYFNIVLFGADAANPHGGVDESRELEECEFVLIDVGPKPPSSSCADWVGAVFLGYSSDITRTFLPRRTEIDECGTTGSYSLIELWDTVHAAQGAAIKAMTLNASCADVDLAARKVIEDAGYGKYFNHRLGHGLGIEGHERYNNNPFPLCLHFGETNERPYLNKGNTDTKLRVGNVFTVEPGTPFLHMLILTGEGIYIEGVAGVRLEDVVLVTENGPKLLSGHRAKDWFHP